MALETDFALCACAQATLWETDNTKAGHAVDHRAGEADLDLLGGQSPGLEAPADQNLVPVESRFHKRALPQAVAVCQPILPFLARTWMCRSR
jgi:hypothetical protein